MRKLLLYALAVMPVLLFGQQKGFVLQGKLGHWNAPAKLYLVYAGSPGQITDSATLQDGLFSIKGQVSEPVAATLILDRTGAGLAMLNNTNADFTGLYLDNETIEVHSDDSVKTARVSGSSINEELAKYNAFMQQHISLSTALHRELATASPEKQNDSAFQREISEKTAAAHRQGVEALGRYIGQNPSSYFCLVALTNLVQIKADGKATDSLFRTLPPALQHTAQGKTIEKAIAALRATSIGAIAPLFTQIDTSGKRVGLADFKGRYVLIDFWASWCEPCRAENPNVVKAYRQYHSKGLEIIGISLDDSTRKDAWLEAIRQDGLTWSQLSDLKGGMNEAGQLYGVQSIPQNYLIDREGRIVAANLRGGDLEKKLAEILGK